MKRGIAAMAAAIATMGMQGPPAAGQDGAAPPRMPGRLVDVGGWRLHINCEGEARPGQPTVVLESGGGDFSATWALVQPRVAAFARVCSYDRAGAGWSDLGPIPRTMRQTVYELHTLLDRAGVAPPYVLAGHSFGGFLVRLYTTTYPADVSGIVMVDASHEDDLIGFNGKMMRWWEIGSGKAVPSVKTSGPMREDDIPASVKDAIQRSLKQPRRVNGPPFDRLPIDAQQARTWALSQLKSNLPAQTDFDGEEVVALRANRQKDPRPFGDRPLIVVTRGVSGYGREPLAEQRDVERKAHQADLVNLSRRGSQVIAEGSGHQVHVEAPALVAQAINDAVSTVRGR